MDLNTVAAVIAGGGALGVIVWVLAKVGKALVKIAEALAAAAVVFLTIWLAIKALLWALRQTVTHWRGTLVTRLLGRLTSAPRISWRGWDRTVLGPR
jgi:S-DNA-T family DNA segregation ATPase FtsK/SpoIIIE